MAAPARDYSIPGSHGIRIFTTIGAVADLVFAYNPGMLPEIQVSPSKHCRVLLFARTSPFTICAEYIAGNHKASCGQEHGESSVVPVHRWLVASLRCNLYGLLGLWFLNINLSTEQRQRPSLDKSHCKYVGLSSDRHSVTRKPLSLCSSSPNCSI